jgi:hypothetical protein
MMRRAFRRAACAAATLVAACAPAQSHMQRALDPSIERVLRAESYIQTVAGITGNASRLMRGDGFVYLSDVAPQLRYLAQTGDVARYRSLRTFVQQDMLRRDSTGLTPARRYRRDATFEKATAYGYHWLSEALKDGWRLLADTASAQLLAQVNWSAEEMTQAYASTYGYTMRCADAAEEARENPAPGRAILARADREMRALSVIGAEFELDVLACMTRLAIAVQDADKSVNYVDRMLDILEPFLTHSGRPDAGTSADILLTFKRVREAGPHYYDPRVGSVH